MLMSRHRVVEITQLVNEFYLSILCDRFTMRKITNKELPVELAHRNRTARLGIPVRVIGKTCVSVLLVVFVVLFEYNQSLTTLSSVKFADIES